MRRRLSLEAYAQGVLSGNRSVLARAITLMESSRADDVQLAQRLLSELLPHTGGAIRIGLTGTPGVGKSTTLDRLGMMLLEKGHRVAVLAVDPSSTRTGGSILGDKTRMVRLAADPRAYIRPSPSGGALGGIAKKTRETLFLCEAAGFDVIVIETVGVGQSETMVSELTDVFVALMLPGGGDELQGIKKGVLELADIVAINKADGERLVLARKTMREYRAAQRYLRRKNPNWRPKTMLLSAQTGLGVEDLWKEICAHREALGPALFELRKKQELQWVWSMAENRLVQNYREKTQTLRTELEAQLRSGTITSTQALWRLLERLP